MAAFPALSARGVKDETIEAAAMGTSTQMGAMVGISVEIYEYSTPADKQTLVQAFATGHNQGLEGSGQNEGCWPHFHHRHAGDAWLRFG